MDHKLKIVYSEIQIIGDCQRTKKKKKKTMENKCDGITNCILCTWNDLRKLGKENRAIRHQKKNRDYSDYSILMIG